MEIAKEDNKGKSYKREPQFSFTLTNNYEYSSPSKDKFLKSLGQSDLGLLKSLSFDFYGENNILRFEYDRGFLEAVRYKIETNNDKSYFYLKEKVEALTGKGNINWALHEYWSQLMLLLFFLALILITFRLYAPQIMRDLLNSFPFAILLSSLLWFFISFVPIKYYPRLIIAFEDKKMGRNLKADLWKIILFLISAIVLPFILKKMNLQ